MPNSLSLARFLPYRCNSLARKISVSLSRIYSDRFGLSIPQWRVLVTLAEYGELQARQVTELTTLDKVQVSRAVAGLAERGLLRRRSCDRDSRASLLRLSESGLAMFRRIEPEALAWEEALLAPLQAGERDTLFNLLDRLDLQLQAMAPTPDGTERPESAA